MAEGISFEMVLKNAASLPIFKIDRRAFLYSALSPHFDPDTVNKAIKFTPAYAGIYPDKLEKIAISSINFETTKVTALSFATGVPGGPAMIATIPADLVQYMAHILRIVQKLAYLYSWPELFDANGQMNDETANLLTIFVGIMFGVNGAVNAAVKVSEAAAQKTAKSLAHKALTKGAIYPIVKKIATALGIKMTREVFAKSVSKMIPIIGGFASGAVTLATYRPMSIKLKTHLSTLSIANPKFY